MKNNLILSRHRQKDLEESVLMFAMNSQMAHQKICIGKYIYIYIYDRNGKDLTEAEDIKKRWQEYIEELYKEVLTDPDNHHGMVTHLEPDILECEVKHALGCITMN